MIRDVGDYLFLSRAVGDHCSYAVFSYPKADALHDQISFRIHANIDQALPVHYGERRKTGISDDRINGFMVLGIDNIDAHGKRQSVLRALGAVEAGNGVKKAVMWDEIGCLEAARGDDGMNMSESSILFMRRFLAIGVENTNRFILRDSGGFLTRLEKIGFVLKILYLMDLF